MDFLDDLLFTDEEVFHYFINDDFDEDDPEPMEIPESLQARWRMMEEIKRRLAEASDPDPLGIRD